jgi:hypothetical protein
VISGTIRLMSSLKAAECNDHAQPDRSTGAAILSIHVCCVQRKGVLCWAPVLRHVTLMLLMLVLGAQSRMATMGLSVGFRSDV